MSVRLPSQRKFAPSKPKLGGRPGGPTVGGPPKAPSSSFVRPHPPLAAATGAAAGAVAHNIVAPSAAASNTTNEADGNAIAGPSSRPDTSAVAGDKSSGSAIPTSQLFEARRSMSPVKRPATLPASTSITGNAAPSGSFRGRSRSPVTSEPTASTARTLLPGLSPMAATRPTPVSQFRPSASPAPSSRPPLAIPKPRRAPSASPAPPRSRPEPVAKAISTRVSASPAPSARQRSVSRQPSLTPSMRTGGRPALIAAAENRASPLNIPPSAKERRKAEKARAAEAERESERGTPAPAAHVPGMPPSLGAAPRDDEDVDMEQAVPSSAPASRQASSTPVPEKRRNGGAPRAFTQAEREPTQAVAAALVDQIGASGTPAPAFARARDRTPLFLAEVPEDEDEPERPADGSGAPDERESGDSTEEYDSDGQVVRKAGTAVAKKVKKPRAPRAVISRKAIAPQRKRYKKRGAAKVREEESGDEEESGEEDEELNELDISDNDDLSLSAKKGRKRGVKRKRKTRSPVFQPVNLDEAEAGELIGEEVDEENMRMADIATTRSGEGKVSAKGKNLSVYLRDFSKRNKDRLDEESHDKYERRQILRRQLRANNNAKKAAKREAVAARGGDPDVEVSEDEMDSETEFEVRPERLTPEPTPEPGGPRPEAEAEADEDAIEEEEYVEPPEGTRPAGLSDEEEEEAPPEEEPEEEIFDPNTHMMDERHEDEEFDPELAALGFAPAAPGAYRDDEMLDENGETMDDLIDQLAEGRRAVMRHNDTREVIEEEQTGKMPNNRSYAKKANNERWSAEETEFFYQVLGETGENYTLMSFYFPSRTPRQLKNKSKKENMANPGRVNEAIKARRPIDPEYLQKTIGYDPRGPTEEADQLLEETRDLPARWTREDTDRVLADLPEEDGDGEPRVEEFNYEDLADASGDKEEGVPEEEEEEEEEDKGDEEEEEEDMGEEEEDQGGYGDD